MWISKPVRTGAALLGEALTAWIALAKYLVGLVLAIGVRSLVHGRGTGDSKVGIIRRHRHTLS